MLKSIRTKLTVTYIILIVTVMVSSSFLLLNILKQYYFDYQYTEMTRSAALISSFVAPKLVDKPDVVDISNVAFDFARQFNARVIVTDHKQRVVGDSQRIEGLVGTTLERKEIAAALEQKEKWTVQYSDLSKTWVLQVAVPVLQEDKVVGAVFLASSLSQIHGIQRDIRNYLIIATVLAVIVAGLLGRFLARKMTDPLQALTVAAEKMARGDLSQQVKVSTNDEIGRLTIKFNEMARQLQQSTKQLKEFVANASHEMRTPLTSLNILVKSIRDYPLSKEEQQEFLEDIDEELERLIRLVDDLLDLTRLDSVASDDTMVLLDIVPAVQSTLEMLRKRAEEKGLIFSYSLPERAAPVLVVLHQIKQIVFNLVDNAIKYTPAGGQIKVTLKEEGDVLKFCVSDTGVGIPEDQREKIFERFYRVDKARSREQGGTGLGLSIVREIVKRHGGKVWVEDGEQGHGSTFIVTLPVPELPAEEN
ncbi:MAG: cell wall metabolism sensor histidine kinase WalK [Firmicutes bacterium]|nr:cell wall metabolism sensor histidine kinase WalK [Bacillota bacterium]